MLFSQRNLLAKECEAWCQRNGASLEPVNILAALQSLGVCLDRPIPVSERLPKPVIAPEPIESKPIVTRNTLESGGPIAISAGLAAGERVEIKMQDEVADNYSLAGLIDKVDETRFAIQKFHEFLCNQSLKQDWPRPAPE